MSDCRRTTKALIETLDAVTPVQPRALAEEKGKLKSRRTILQLYEDAIVHVRNLRLKRPCPTGDETRPAKKNSYADFLRTPKTSQASIDSQIFIHGMLSSRSLLFVVCSLPELQVVAASEAVDMLYRDSPSVGIIGQNLLHFIHFKDFWKVRKVARQAQAGELAGGESKAEALMQEQFEAKLATFLDVSCRGVDKEYMCRGITFTEFCWFPVHVSPDDKIAFILQEKSSSPPRPPSAADAFVPSIPRCPNRFRSRNELRRISATFYFDEICSTAFPWNVDAAMQRIQANAHPPFIQRAISSMAWTESARRVVQRITGDVGHEYSSRTTSSLSRVVTRMCQIHVFVDLNEHGVPYLVSHMRLRMPQWIGSIKTPWVLIETANLDGSPTQMPTAENDKYVGYYLDQSSPPDELHISARFYERVDGQYRCYHTRTTVMQPDHIHGRCIKVFGEVFKSATEAPYEFVHALNKTEEADPALVESLRAAGNAQAIGEADSATPTPVMQMENVDMSTDPSFLALPSFYAERNGYPHKSSPSTRFSN